MVQWQFVQGIDMVQFHWEDAQVISGLLPLDHLRQRYSQLQAADLAFDLDLPGTNDTQIELVGGIFARRQGGMGQFLRATI
jgi:hypothetical protein